MIRDWVIGSQIGGEEVFGLAAVRVFSRIRDDGESARNADGVFLAMSSAASRGMRKRAPRRLGPEAYGVAPQRAPCWRMQLYHIDIFKRRDWRRGDVFTRRMIEIRYAVACAVREHRKRAGISQQRLAYLLDGAPSTISAIERASSRVSLDHAVRALVVLGADDDAVGAAFNAGLRRDVQVLRRRASRPLFGDLNYDSKFP